MNEITPLKGEYLEIYNAIALMAKEKISNETFRKMKLEALFLHLAQAQKDYRGVDYVIGKDLGVFAEKFCTQPFRPLKNNLLFVTLFYWAMAYGVIEFVVYAKGQFNFSVDILNIVPFMIMMCAYVVFDKLSMKTGVLQMDEQYNINITTASSVLIATVFMLCLRLNLKTVGLPFTVYMTIAATLFVFACISLFKGNTSGYECDDVKGLKKQTVLSCIEAIKLYEGYLLYCRDFNRRPQSTQTFFERYENKHGDVKKICIRSVVWVIVLLLIGCGAVQIIDRSSTSGSGYETGLFIVFLAFYLIGAKIPNHIYMTLRTKRIAELFEYLRKNGMCMMELKEKIENKTGVAI